MKEKERARVQRREEAFAIRTATKIWHEEPDEENPYLAKRCGCAGYDLFDLMEKRDLVDMIYLLFLGELPTRDQARLLQTLMIALINPGPRHPATRAAMNAGVGKTNTAIILPAALSVMSGAHLGGNEVTAAMRFFNKYLEDEPEEIAEDLRQNSTPPEEGDWHITPGFGNRFGGIDPMPREIARRIARLPGSGEAMDWSQALVDFLEPYGMGWLATGVAAAVFHDLGLPARAGASFYQLVCAPGLLAHGLELADKPITAMPFIDEEHYVIADEAKKRKD